jgi:hypothetical protein
MKKISFLFFPFLFLLIVAGSVSAHVILEYPLGGETLTVGSKIEIKWRIQIPHGPNNWDLYFSSNGGVIWVPVQLDLDSSDVDYHWTIPNELTENARIKIVQDNENYINFEDESGNFTITDVQTSIGVQEGNPKVFKLHSNYPNPFNPGTTINYDLPSTMIIDLSIYNLLGQQVVTLVSGRQKAGSHSVKWDASHLSAGAYFIKLHADEFIQIKKAILLK